jgi:sortase A
MSRPVLRVWLPLLLVLAALYQAGSGLHIVGKAHVAQFLLEHAWQESAAAQQPVRPWPSADTWPVARLSFPERNRSLIVLDGASLRNLAFGPVVVKGEEGIEAVGAVVIAGHRDTHFAVLADLKIGDRIRLDRDHQSEVFRVAEMFVVDQSSTQMLSDDSDSLWLVTCYPFVAVSPGTRWRYVVRAFPERRLTSVGA